MEDLKTAEQANIVVQSNDVSMVTDSLINNFNGLLDMTNRYAKLIAERKPDGENEKIAADVQALVNDMQESLEAAKQMQQNGILLEDALNSDNEEISAAAKEILADLEEKAEGIKEVSQELDKTISDIVLAQEALDAGEMIPEVIKDGAYRRDILVPESDTGINGFIAAVNSAGQIAEQYMEDDTHFTDYYTSGQFERDQAQRHKTLNSLKRNVVNVLRPINNNLQPYVSCMKATADYLAASSKANAYSINHTVKDSMMNAFRKVSGIFRDAIENAKIILIKTGQYAKDLTHSTAKHYNILVDRITLGGHSYLNSIAAQKADRLKNSIGNDAAQIDNNNGGAMSIQVLEYTPFDKFQMRVDELSAKMHQTDEKAYWKDIHDSAWKNGKSPVEHVISAFVSAKEKTSFENIKRCVSTKSAELDRKLKDKKQEIKDSIKAAGEAVKHFPGSVAKKTMDGINTLRADALVNEARFYARIAEYHVNGMHKNENKYQKLYDTDIKIQSKMEEIRETLAKLSPDYESRNYIPKPYDAAEMLAAREALCAQFNSNDITLKQFNKAVKALESDYKREENNFTKSQNKNVADINKLQAEIKIWETLHTVYESRMDAVAKKCIKKEERTNSIINERINQRFDKASKLNTERDYAKIDNIKSDVPHKNGDNSDDFTDESFGMA